MNTIIIALLFLLELFLFFSTGLLLCTLLNLNVKSITLTLLTGFLSFFCLFGIIAIPMIFMSCKLSTLTYTIMILSAIIIILSLIFGYKRYPLFFKRLLKNIQQHSYMIIFLILAVFIQQLIIFNHIDWSADASYYIGKVTTDVYTNTMGHYNPYTGAALKSLDSRRVFACFQEFNAVIAQFFNIHPLKQAKLIMPQILALMTSILYYQVGLQLFDGNKKKSDLLVFFVVLLDIFSNTIYTNSTFLLTRTYEGKSILANIIIPAMIYCFLRLWKKYQIKLTNILLIIISFSSCIFTASSMMIVPVGLTAGLLPWIIKEREWKKIPLYILCVIPNMFVCIVYLLASKELITFTIGG